MGLADVEVGAAQPRGVADGIGRQSGDGWAGKEGHLEAAASDIGDRPLGFFGAAERVVVQEALVGGNLKAVEIATTAGVGTEEGLGFRWFECTDLGDGEG